jgi:hypothetical protein
LSAYLNYWSNFLVHEGITSKDVKDKPTFAEAMQQLIEFVELCCQEAYAMQNIAMQNITMQNNSAVEQSYDGNDNASSYNLSLTASACIASSSELPHDPQFMKSRSSQPLVIKAQQGFHVVIVAHNGLHFDFKVGHHWRDDEGPTTNDAMHCNSQMLL